VARRIVYLMESILESEASHPVASGQQEKLFGLRIFMKAARILLADDQEEMLRTIVLVLGNEFDIVGTAENRQRAIELTRILSPDILSLGHLHARGKRNRSCLVSERAWFLRKGHISDGARGP